MEAHLVQKELKSFVHSDWNWEALPHGDDVFLVTFPSEEELHRWDDVELRLKNHGVTLNISVWKEDGDVTSANALDVVWVHITGVPHKWRGYLGFWAVGSMIGAMQDVDMYTFRKKKVSSKFRCT